MTNFWKNLGRDLGRKVNAAVFVDGTGDCKSAQDYLKQVTTVTGDENACNLAKSAVQSITDRYDQDDVPDISGVIEVEDTVEGIDDPGQAKKIRRKVLTMMGKDPDQMVHDGTNRINGYNDLVSEADEKYQEAKKDYGQAMSDLVDRENKADSDYTAGCDAAEAKRKTSIQEADAELQTGELKEREDNATNLAQLKSDHDAAIAAENERYSAAIAAENERYDQAVSDLRAENDSKKTEIAGEYKDTLASLEEEHNAIKADVEQQRDELKANLKGVEAFRSEVKSIINPIIEQINDWIDKIKK